MRLDDMVKLIEKSDNGPILCAVLEACEQRLKEIGYHKPKSALGIGTQDVMAPYQVSKPCMSKAEIHEE